MILLLILTLGTQLTFGQTEKIRLLDFKYSECEETTLSTRLRTRIVKKQINANIITLDIATVITCCVKIDPLISIKGNILHLDIEESGPGCECYCYYTLTYQIKGIKDESTIIRFRGKDIELSDEKYLTYPLKFRIFNGDTLDFVDKYGYRQGKWAYSNDPTMTNGYFEVKDDVPVKLVTIYPDKSIKSLTRRDGIVKKDSNGKDYHTHSNYNYYVEYFASGARKRECVSSNTDDSYKDPSGRCREWNEKGELVYEGVYRK